MEENGGVLFRGYAGGGVLFGVGGGTHVRAHPARVDGVHADPAPRELCGQDLGEPLYPELAHRIGAPLGPSLNADTADHVDHGAALWEMWDRRLGDKERPCKVGVYDLSPLVLGILFYPDPGTQQAGVVDEHVYLPETLDRLADHPLDVGALRHVRREGQDLRARIFDFFGDRTDGLFAAGVDSHPGTLSRKGERERPAEALASAGDHYYLAFEHLTPSGRVKDFRYQVPDSPRPPWPTRLPFQGLRPRRDLRRRLPPSALLRPPPTPVRRGRRAGRWLVLSPRPPRRQGPLSRSSQCNEKAQPLVEYAVGGSPLLRQTVCLSTPGT